MEVTLGPDFGYVALVVAASLILHLYLGSRVVKARKKYKVPYPAMYATESENKDAKLFNCVQRGHQNFLESIPFFLSLLLICSFQYPKLAAVMGLGYLVSRYFYFTGYASGVPENRMKLGSFQYVFILGLLGLTIVFAVQTIMSR